jgi:hypothetical protein
MVPPQWGASSIDHHDCVLPGERHCIASAWIFIELRTLGEGPRGLEAPHDAIILELLPGGACVVWVDFLEEPLEAACRWPRLSLVHSGRVASHTGATRLPIVAIIIIGRGRGPLRALLVHRFATLDALLSIIYGDVRWCLLVAARGHFPTSLVLAKHDRTIAGGVLGGDAAWLLECVPKKVTMLALEKASCVALGQRVHDPLVSLADLS